MNWYAYVGNNPVNNVDPLGLRGEVIFMQHGLGSSAQEFEETVRELKKKTNKNGMLKYKSLGIVSKRGKTTQNTYKDISFNVGYFRAMKMCMANSKISDLKMGIPHYLDQITEDDTNVIIRTEFSKGTLLFSEQHDELRDMVAQFGNFMSDVTFVGHSMGGLASINYGLTYAGEHPNKQVNIITVSTPYEANIGATALALRKDALLVFFAGDNALDSLGGLNNELSDLKNKWNNSNLSNTSLSAISVALSNITGLKYQDFIGDGVVSLGSQKGDGYKDVNILPPVLGNSDFVIILPVANALNQAYHTKTPELSGVINQLDKLMGRAS